MAFGDFFGRAALAGTSGLRISIVGIALWLAPRWAGAAADSRGTYDAAFTVIAGLCVTGAVVALLTRAPARAAQQAT